MTLRGDVYVSRANAKGGDYANTRHDYDNNMQCSCNNHQWER